MNAVDEDDDDEGMEDYGKGIFVNAIGDNHADVMWFKIGGVLTELTIDSSSKFNIIGEGAWMHMKQNQANFTAVRPSNKKLVAYAQSERLSIVLI